MIEKLIFITVGIIISAQ